MSQASETLSWKVWKEPPPPVRRAAFTLPGMAALLCRQNVELLDDGKPLSTLLAHMTALVVTEGHANGSWRCHGHWYHDNSVTEQPWQFAAPEKLRELQFSFADEVVIWRWLSVEPAQITSLWTPGQLLSGSVSGRGSADPNLLLADGISHNKHRTYLSTIQNKYRSTQ